MSDDIARRIALLLRALEDMDRERSEYLTDWKGRREILEKQLDRLKDDILSGQQALPIEPIPEVTSA